MHHRFPRGRFVWMTWSTLVILGLTGMASAEQASGTSAVEGIAELVWLAGCWQGPGGEECWLPPDGGRMIGVNRAPDGGMYEFLRIEQGAEGGLVYHASPKGRCPATAFAATHIAERRVRFENPSHDFPQRIEYWLDETGRLHASVTAASKDGSQQGFVVTWQRSSWSPQSSRL